MNSTVAAILAEQGVIATKQYPTLGPTLRRLYARDELTNPLPGVFLPGGPSEPLAWLRAVSLWSAPAGVLHGASAASLWMPELRSPVARLAHPTLRGRRGVVVTRRSVPPEYVRQAWGVRTASPAFSATELAADDDGRAACEALRLKLTTPEDLHAAMLAMAGSRGQAERRRAIEACADNPWSYAELRLHRILRAAQIGGWVGNRAIIVRGRKYAPDARFPARRVIIEVDGRATHQAPGQFQQDRERQNEFAMAGFRVIRFTWEHLDDPDYVVRVVREVLRVADR